MDKVISKEDYSNILRLVAGRVLNFITTILRFFKGLSLLSAALLCMSTPNITQYHLCFKKISICEGLPTTTGFALFLLCELLQIGEAL